MGCALSFSKVYREKTVQRMGLVSLPRRGIARIQLNMNMKTNCFGCHHPHCSGKWQLAARVAVEAAVEVPQTRKLLLSSLDAYCHSVYLDACEH